MSVYHRVNCNAETKVLHVPVRQPRDFSPRSLGIENEAPSHPRLLVEDIAYCKHCGWFDDDACVRAAGKHATSEDRIRIRDMVAATIRGDFS